MALSVGVAGSPASDISSEDREQGIPWAVQFLSPSGWTTAYNSIFFLLCLCDLLQQILFFPVAGLIFFFFNLCGFFFFLLGKPLFIEAVLSELGNVK